MGVHKNIGYDKFPKQGNLLYEEVMVCFDYDTSRLLIGKVIRDDVESPFLTLIELENKRVVSATECQYFKE